MNTPAGERNQQGTLVANGLDSVERNQYDQGIFKNVVIKCTKKLGAEQGSKSARVEQGKRDRVTFGHLVCVSYHPVKGATELSLRLTLDVAGPINGVHHLSAIEHRHFGWTVFRPA